MPDRYRQRARVLPQRRHPALRAAEARRLSLLRRLGLRKAAPLPHDDKADPDRLAAVGAQVRERLLSDPRAEWLGNEQADLFAVRAFAPTETCAALIERIDAQAEPSTLFRDGVSQQTSVRTSSTHHFRDDPLADALAGSIDALLGLDRALAEPLQGQRYMAGEEYRHHTDLFRRDRPHWQRERLRGGQRTWTAMLYLNDVAEGGETDFPHLHRRIEPGAGLLLAWNNLTRDGRPNRALLHAGLPVERGRKYVVTQWYRLEPWQWSSGLA